MYWATGPINVIVISIFILEVSLLIVIFRGR